MDGQDRIKALEIGYEFAESIAMPENPQVNLALQIRNGVSRALGTERTSREVDEFSRWDRSLAEL